MTPAKCSPDDFARSLAELLRVARAPRESGDDAAEFVAVACARFDAGITPAGLERVLAAAGLEPLEAYRARAMSAFSAESFAIESDKAGGKGA